MMQICHFPFDLVIDIIYHAMFYLVYHSMLWHIDHIMVEVSIFDGGKPAFDDDDVG